MPKGVFCFCIFVFADVKNIILWYNKTMKKEISRQYKYRKWPLFLPIFLFFSVFYFFSVYSLKELSYKTFIETVEMTLFVVTFPLLSYFHLKIVKINKYKLLAVELFYAWSITTVVIFILMLTYMTGWNWFGAIAFLFFFFCFFLINLFFSYIYFVVKKRQRIKK